MRSIPIDGLVDLLKKLMELVPYCAVAGWVDSKGIDQGEEGEEESMSEG